MVVLVSAVAPQHVLPQTLGPVEPGPQVVQEHRLRGHSSLGANTREGVKDTR